MITMKPKTTLGIILQLSILASCFNYSQAGLKQFKKDFESAPVAAAPIVATEEEKQPAQPTAQANAAYNPAPIYIAQAQNSELNNFYNDFKPKPKDSGSGDGSQQQQQGGNTYNYYTTPYTPEYYQYNYPYYYPYNRFYPGMGMGGQTVIIDQSEYPGATPRERFEQSKPQAPPRHTWYNTALNYQTVSDKISDIGMMFDFISAGKPSDIAWGFKFDYNLYTEKLENENVSLSISNVGVVLGKQLGEGLVESFISYCQMEDLSGISLKLSTDQWFHKNFFATGGFGASIINSSPLTDLNAGIGVGNPMVQFILGYKSVSSSNSQLNGPEIKIRVVM